MCNAYFPDEFRVCNAYFPDDFPIGTGVGCNALKFNVEIDKDLKYLKPSFRTFREIYSIGLPAIISQALLTVMTYGLNIILGQINEVGPLYI